MSAQFKDVSSASTSPWYMDPGRLPVAPSLHVEAYLVFVESSPFSFRVNGQGVGVVDITNADNTEKDTDASGSEAVRGMQKAFVRRIVKPK